MRTKMHELVDIVLDAREITGQDLRLDIGANVDFWNHSQKAEDGRVVYYGSHNFHSFDAFFEAVKNYIQKIKK